MTAVEDARPAPATPPEIGGIGARPDVSLERKEWPVRDPGAFAEHDRRSLLPQTRMARRAPFVRCVGQQSQAGRAAQRLHSWPPSLVSYLRLE